MKTGKWIYLAAVLVVIGMIGKSGLRKMKGMQADDWAASGKGA